MTHPRDFVTRENILSEINKAFLSRHADYNERRKEARAALKKSSNKIDNFIKAGAPMHCALQVFNEAKWLTNYAEAWDRVAALCRKLEFLTQEPDYSPLRQCEDGSWGRFYRTPFLKIEPTVDALQSQSIQAEPIKPLRFMKHLQKPEALLALLYRLQISEIGVTGLNLRDELGAMLSNLSQLIFKDEIRALLANPAFGFKITPRLEDIYRDFLKQTQHPRTGYWGPWYRFGDRLVMVQDLSFTFHNVSYHSGHIDRWSEVIDTTLAIRTLTYPGGWRPQDGTEPFNNHNNYDVIQIFFYGWPHMSHDQKSKACEAVHAMVTWCFASSLKGNSFAEDPTVDGYYYGVRFLDRAGYWDLSNRFWLYGGRTMPPGPDPYALANELAEGFEKVKDDSAESESVAAILDRSLRLTRPGARGLRA